MSPRIQLQYSSENSQKIGLQNLFRKTEFAIYKRDVNMHGGMTLKGQKRQMIFPVPSCLWRLEMMFLFWGIIAMAKIEEDS